MGQKQPPEVFFKKALKKISNIHRKTTVLESLLNKVAAFQPCSFIRKILRHRCFPVNIAKFLRTPILKSICQQLLLMGSQYKILGRGKRIVNPACVISRIRVEFPSPTNNCTGFKEFVDLEV